MQSLDFTLECCGRRTQPLFSDKIFTSLDNSIESMLAVTVQVQHVNLRKA